MSRTPKGSVQIGGFTVLSADSAARIGLGGVSAADVVAPTFAAPSDVEAAREASVVEHATLSNWTDARANHASLEWRVDFATSTIVGAVTYEVKTLKPGVREFVVDTNAGLVVHRAFVDDAEVAAVAGRAHPVFGTPVSVPLPAAPRDKVFGYAVRLEYATAPECSAAQWLDPAQTAGKRRPFDSGVLYARLASSRPIDSRVSPIGTCSRSARRSTRGRWCRARTRRAPS
jgi:hypothetical protein